MAKKESTSLQARPGRITRKGTRPNDTAQPKATLVDGVWVPRHPGRGRPASGYNHLTGDWDMQTVRPSIK